MLLQGGLDTRAGLGLSGAAGVTWLPSGMDVTAIRGAALCSQVPGGGAPLRAASVQFSSEGRDPSFYCTGLEGTQSTLALSSYGILWPKRLWLDGVTGAHAGLCVQGPALLTVFYKL